MDHLELKDWIDRYSKPPKLDAVPVLNASSNIQLKFWPYKFAGLMIYGEIPGIKRLPGRVILAPLPVLQRLSGIVNEKIRNYLRDAVDLGFFEDVEFYSNHALILVAPTPWESGLLDYPPAQPSNNTHSAGDDE